MSPRVAFITGGAQGIGAAIAQSLHAAGHAIVLADINLERAQATAEMLRTLGDAPVKAVALDVRSQHDVIRIVREVSGDLGGVDILVNNAGLTRARDFFELALEEWDEILEVNLRSMFLTCQAIAPGMIERKWGRIINLASLSGQRGGPQVQGLHYATSKAGIIGLSRYLAYEFAPHGVTVNTIAPGPIVTEQTKLAPPEKLARVAADLPVRRLGDAEDVGALAAFLCSDNGGFITGAIQDINGGLLMR